MLIACREFFAVFEQAKEPPLEGGTWQSRQAAGKPTVLQADEMLRMTHMHQPGGDSNARRIKGRSSPDLAGGLW